MLRLLPVLFWLMALPVFGAHLDGAAVERKAPAPAVAEASEETVPTPPPPNHALPAPTSQAAVAALPSSAIPVRVLVIEVREQIADPVLFVLRRGLKTAATGDVVVLDMKTPGGSVATTLEIAEALEMFKGRKVTYVNDEALSAGALIASMTDEIYFRPGGVMGAAAAVSSTGADIGKTMRLKVNSMLLAKVRAWAEGRGRYRGQVLSAMVDEDFEFKIGDTIIKAKGSLLSVNSTEAAKTYGDPAEPLLSAGTYKTLEDLLTARYGVGNYRIERLELTWSENLAQYITNYASIIMGLGLLFLFIEFKTPGFGFFGITGGALLMVVFFGHYVAGLSGYEPALFFALGLTLLLVELVFFPGVIVVALTGVLLMFGSLLWSMVDHWPSQPIELSGEVLVKPMTNLLLGVAVAIVLGALIARFLPKGWFFSRLAVEGGAGAPAQVAGMPPEHAAHATTMVGARGVAATGLYPGGQVEIADRRYEARLELGTAEPGTPVVVVRVADFGLIVEVEHS